MSKMKICNRELNSKNFDIELKDVSFGYDSRKVIGHVSALKTLNG